MTRTLHRHTFVGVDVSLLPPDEFPGYESMRELTREMLRGAVDVQASVDGTTRQLSVTISNLAGHRLPSGATAERQMWIEVLATNEVSCFVEVPNYCDLYPCKPGYSPHPQPYMMCCQYGVCWHYTTGGDCTYGDISWCSSGVTNEDGTVTCLDEYN